MDAVRSRIETLMRERGDDCLSLSRLLGRNDAYMQQFLKRGVPRKLHEDDRRTLARYFGIGEHELGGPPAAAQGLDGVVLVPRLLIGASAGTGSLADGGDQAGSLGFERRWLRRLSPRPDALSIIQVEGDSMSPLLCDGDDILVDTGDGAQAVRDGVYVLRLDDALMVKRVALLPGGAFRVSSENPAFPSWPAVEAERVRVVGRVIWAGRAIR